MSATPDHPRPARSEGTAEGAPVSGLRFTVLIPARLGSSRLPNKPLADICGKPMIAWSIEAAQASGCFDKIIVSTDDTEIAEVARAHGAQVPFMRPPKLSDDHTGTTPVIAHAVDFGKTEEIQNVLKEVDEEQKMIMSFISKLNQSS